MLSLRLWFFLAPLRETFSYSHDGKRNRDDYRRAAYKIHKRLGPGLLESVYETTLAYELAKRGLELRRQQAMPVVYESFKWTLAFEPI